MRRMHGLALLGALASLQLILNPGALAEDLVFEDPNASQQTEDLQFDESETEVIYSENPQHANNIIRQCYYYNKCPKHLPRDDLATVFGGDQNWINELAGPKPPDAVPFVDPGLVAGACDRLRTLVNESRTRLARTARRYLGGGVLANDEQCLVFLQGMRAEGTSQ